MFIVKQKKFLDFFLLALVNVLGITYIRTAEHYPLMICSSSTSIDPKQAFDPIVDDFLLGLKAGVPIIVSSGILDHFLIHQIDKSYIYFDPKKIHFFSVKDFSGIWIIVPRTLNPSELFNTSSLIDITSTLNQYNKNNDFDLRWELSDDMDHKIINRTLLEKIFITKKKPSLLKDPTLPTWDIYLTGHGEKDKTIANIPLNEIQKIILFFNTHVNSGILFINTCYIGGTNLKTIQYENTLNKNNVLSNVNYTIVALGVEDEPTRHIKFNFKRLFKLAAAFDKKESSLDDLLNYFEFYLSYPYTTTPQFWLPHTSGFKGFNIGSTIRVITKVQAQAAELENKTINTSTEKKVTRLINNKKESVSVKIKPKLLIINPPFLRNPLIIHAIDGTIPATLTFDVSPSTDLKNISDFMDKFSEKAFNVNFPIVAKVGLNPLTKEFYKFPKIVLMAQDKEGNRMGHFNKIIAYNTEKELNKPYVNGFLAFILNGFLNNEDKRSNSTILIDTLIGTNDLAFSFEVIRLKEKITEPFEYESLFKEDESPFTNVIVFFDPNLKYPSNKAISFEYKGKAWNYTAKECTEINIEDHRKKYKILSEEIDSLNKPKIIEGIGKKIEKQE